MKKNLIIMYLIIYNDVLFIERYVNVSYNYTNLHKKSFFSLPYSLICTYF